MDQRHERKSIVGRDADAARDARAADGRAIAEQLNATTSAAAGGTVTGSDKAETDLDIVFEREEPDQ